MEEKIPQQKTGAQSDTVSDMEMENEMMAAEHFETVKKRFFDVNSWELFAGEEKAEFSLRDKNGNILLGKPNIGDYFSIKVPGLHNSTGNEFDWVQVEHIEEEKKAHSESVYIRVRPAPDPTKSDEKTAHFFDEKATSNFLIKRDGLKISAEVHGRNEVPNTDDLNVLKKIRNALVAVGGMIAGSKFQWKSLTEGLVKYEK
ncbi:hypothetical protein [Chryseobacterium sp.]|uniref:hypothetical protein n=1 Tax=Chryseobacterium sp. TaxID=1871047 RepID=UPI0011CBEC66|nr:hypothetical protein [Chryseobacterium sp.]TXF79314.1 hypothetical protein FUA25_02700 [Chryseobacterium sp.]